jgi:hypothetical protein
MQYAVVPQNELTTPNNPGETPDGLVVFRARRAEPTPSPEIERLGGVGI